MTERADVVLPVAALQEKQGTFLDWEGRARESAQVMREALSMLCTLTASSGGTRLLSFT